MATAAEILKSLKAADAAGDVDAATKLADAYRRALAAESGAVASAPGGALAATPERQVDAELQRVSDMTQPPPPHVTPETQQRYLQALEAVRSTFYPDVPSEEFIKRAEMIDNPSGGIAELVPALKGPLESFGNTSKRLQSGTLAGFDDEMSSGMDALGSQLQKWFGNPNGKDFGQAFAIYQALNEAKKQKLREETGAAGDAAEFIGSMGLMGRAAPAGLFGPSAGASGPAALMTNAAAESVPRNIVRNAALLAVPSAAYGFGDTDGSLTDRIKGAAQGGAMGVAVGTGLTALGRGIAAARRGSQTPANLSVTADDALTRAMHADGSLGSAGERNIRAGGPTAMIADAGENSRALLDAAIARSGAGASRAKQAVEQRVSAADATTQQQLDRTLGRPVGTSTIERNLRTSTATARGDAYDAAYSRPIDYSSEHGFAIEDALTGVPKSAIDEANRLMQARREKPNLHIVATEGPDGRVTFSQRPDVRQLDYITRALNDAAYATVGQGAGGGMTSIGEAYRSLAAEIRASLKQAVPEYATALETAAQPIEARKAVLLGKTLLRPTVERDVVANLVSDMSGPELAAARSGLRAAVDELHANVKRIASDPNLESRELRKVLEDMSSQAAREKIAMIVNDPAEQAALFRSLDESMKSLELKAGVARNSATMGRTVADRTISNSIDGNIVAALLEGAPLKLSQRAVQALSGRTPAAKLAAEDRIWGEIADFLTGPRGQAAIDRLRLLGTRKGYSMPGLPAAVQPLIQFYEEAPPDVRRILESLLGRGKELVKP